MTTSSLDSVIQKRYYKYKICYNRTKYLKAKKNNNLNIMSQLNKYVS